MWTMQLVVFIWSRSGAVSGVNGRPPPGVNGRTCTAAASSLSRCDDCHVARSGSSDVARLGARPLRVAQYFPCLDGVSNFDVEP